MKHTIKCTICNQTQKVNGQKQIEVFVGEHHHNLTHAEWMTSSHIELDEPQDKIDPKPLYTGNHTKSVRDYWRKVPGAI